MKKTDPVVWKETRYIAIWMLIFSACMQAVFLIIGKWNYTVLLGNLLSAVAGVFNFFLMGRTVQNALGKEEKDAKATMKLSQTYRMLLLLAVAIVGALVPCFHLWATLIPLLFPTVAVYLRPLFDKKTS